MSKIILKCLPIFGILVLSMTNCKEGNLTSSTFNDTAFREIINTGGNMEEPTENSDEQLTNSATNVEINNELYNCTTTTHSINAAGGGDDGFPLFNPTAEVIYPGSMLQGNSLNQATPNAIFVDRAGGTIATNVLNGNLVSSFDVDEVKNSSITNAMNNILANSPNNLPANFSINIESIQSREEFALKLGVDVDHAFGSLESKIGYEYNSEKSSFLVSLNQEYYTMSFDIPSSLDGFFAPTATAEQLSNFVGPGNPATFISSVTYGRIFYMLIESTSTQHDLQIAVEGAFEGVTVDVDATLEIDYFNSLENVTYSVFAYGGDAAETFDAIGVSDMSTLRDVLKRSTSLYSAKPISYVVRNLSNKQVVSTQLATQYDVVDCVQISNTGTLPAIAHWTNHPSIAALGPITAAYTNGLDEFVLINEQGDWIKSTINDQGEGELTDPAPWGDGLPFTSVGAACRLQGPGGSLYVFNGLGNKYAVLGTNGNWGGIHDISEFFGGDIPFAGSGVGALAYEYNSNWGHAHTMFNKLGTNKAIGYWNPPPNQSHFSSVTGIDYLSDGISEVGASTNLLLDNGTISDNIEIHFDLSGTAYMLYGDFGTGSEARGPFSL